MKKDGYTLELNWLLRFANTWVSILEVKDDGVLIYDIFDQNNQYLVNDMVELGWVDSFIPSVLIPVTMEQGNITLYQILYLLPNNQKKKGGFITLDVYLHNVLLDQDTYIVGPGNIENTSVLNKSRVINQSYYPLQLAYSMLTGCATLIIAESALSVDVIECQLSDFAEVILTKNSPLKIIASGLERYTNS